MVFNFKVQKAVREKIAVKIALMGPSGSGKSYSALRLATGMLEEMKKTNTLDDTNGRILFANTEGSRGRYYANEFDYDIVDLVPPYQPEQFTELINYAVAEKYSILIIDSSSAEWEGKGGCLELQQQAGGRYQDWKLITPRHDKFIDTMQYSNIHIIATMKGKDQYEVDKDERGRTAVKKLGVGAKQRDGFEYYFTTTFNIDVTSHMAKCEKDNTHIFENEGYTILSEDFGKKIINWANSSDVEATSAKTFAQAPDYDGSGSVSETSELADTINKIGSLAQALVGADKLSKTDLVGIIKKYHTSANYNSITDISVAKNILAELEAKNN